MSAAIAKMRLMISCDIACRFPRLDRHQELTKLKV
jgi:hypothetical protein